MNPVVGAISYVVREAGIVGVGNVYGALGESENDRRRDLHCIFGFFSPRDSIHSLAVIPSFFRVKFLSYPNSEGHR
jgi:hypothetical protein